ncbi:unnamed protein product [Effrenium voratum]|nr:unnamed protein product [Effrenium voratum]
MPGYCELLVPELLRPAFLEFRNYALQGCHHDWPEERCAAELLKMELLEMVKRERQATADPTREAGVICHGYFPGHKTQLARLIRSFRKSAMRRRGIAAELEGQYSSEGHAARAQLEEQKVRRRRRRQPQSRTNVLLEQEEEENPQETRLPASAPGVVAEVVAKRGGRGTRRIPTTSRRSTKTMRSGSRISRPGGTATS